MSSDFAIKWVVQANELPRIRKELRTKGEQFVRKAALDIQAHAAAAAPVDTGTLRNSIRASSDGELSWKVVVGADYGIYVEWGTRHMAARPFLQPAVNKVAPSFLEAIRSIVKP